MKRIIPIILLVLCVFAFTGCKKNSVNTKYKIVATNFPCYDFARAVIKDVDDISVKMLIKPGSETHDFEPTPQDIIDIQESDIFIYVGGESDTWIDNVMDKIDLKKTKIIRLMDIVELYEEETTEGMENEEEEEVEYDEHVWTSPINAIKIIEKIYDEVIIVDNDNKEKYESNKNTYVNELESIDKEFKEVVESSKLKEVVFGDRFPLRYFVEEYGLTYHAAFKGCSEQSEASLSTLTYLIDYVKKNKIPVVFKIELSNGKIADTIAKETNAKVLEFNSSHNISKDDFDKGITYVEIMKNNVEVLKEALN